ncbi:hypothetical protein STFE110948_04790 [Streptobacillus felis]|uniref:Uncharacterized protein n=1 Tax=Streptobacillus felis TaxID=1384509 RepID=A0A7Z0TC14_9FUSO|nr:hypothetical protein [Streptobacillus felis]NYV27953.1 hypothetical protein [Streptobacillus felis]
MEEKIGYSFSYIVSGLVNLFLFLVYIFVIYIFFKDETLSQELPIIPIILIITMLIQIIVYVLVIGLRAKTIFMSNKYFKIGKEGEEISYKNLKYIYIYGYDKTQKRGLFTKMNESNVIAYIKNGGIEYINTYVYNNKKIEELKKRIVDAEITNYINKIELGEEIGFRYKDKGSKIRGFRPKSLAKKIFDFFEDSPKKIVISKEYLSFEGKKYFFGENVFIKKSDQLLVENKEGRTVLKIKQLIVEQSGIFNTLLEKYS